MVLFNSADATLRAGLEGKGLQNYDTVVCECKNATLLAQRRISSKIVTDCQKAISAGEALMEVLPDASSAEAEFLAHLRDAKHDVLGFVKAKKSLDKASTELMSLVEEWKVE